MGLRPHPKERTETMNTHTNDWTIEDENKRAAEAMRTPSAKISVYAACSCSVCASGARWFMCPSITSRFIAAYACLPEFCDCPDVPHPNAIREVSAAHPGTVLVYLDG